MTDLTRPFRLCLFGLEYGGGAVCHAHFYVHSRHSIYLSVYLHHSIVFIVNKINKLQKIFSVCSSLPPQCNLHLCKQVR